MYAKNVFNDPVLDNGFKKIPYDRYLAGNFGFPIKREWKTYCVDYYWIKRDKRNSRYDYEIRMRVKLLPYVVSTVLCNICALPFYLWDGGLKDYFKNFIQIREWETRSINLEWEPEAEQIFADL